MIAEKILPFPRGQTYSQCGRTGAGALVTMADGTASHLEGRLYQVPDTIHNTGHFVTLRIVKNDQGDTAFALDRKLVSFSVASIGDWGRRIDGLATADGTDAVKPIDDAYFYGTQSTAATTAVFHTCAALDLIYVVEEGPCRVLCDTATITAGLMLALSDEDGLGSPSVAGEVGFGTAMEAGNSTASTAVLTMVRAGVQSEVP